MFPLWEAVLLLSTSGEVRNVGGKEVLPGLLVFANYFITTCRGLLWEYHIEWEQGQEDAWTGLQCRSSQDCFPPLHVGLHSRFVPHQEVLKMSSKPHPRNAREYLFSMESGGCNKTELFFASKPVLIKIISFVLRRYHIQIIELENAVLRPEPY